MNEIAKLIKNYNSLIANLRQLDNDLSELLGNTYDFQNEYWCPRDRSAWSNKEKFYAKYTNDVEVFYIGFDLQDDCPYLLLERMYNLKDCAPKDFGEDDAFGHIQDSDIKKINNGVYSFSADWGDTLYAKISLLEITSPEIVQTEIKSVIDCLLGVNNKLSLKIIKLI